MTVEEIFSRCMNVLPNTRANIFRGEQLVASGVWWACDIQVCLEEAKGFRLEGNGDIAVYLADLG